MAGNGSKVTKRSLNACTRCRRQKIKCSGSQPCEGCNKRRLTCIFDDRDQKILVTRGYIDELHQKLAHLQRNEQTDAIPAPNPLSPDYADDRSPDPKDQHDTPGELRRSSLNDNTESQLQNELEDPASGLTNPLSSGPPAFTSAENGRTFYLGPSSNWSFTRRVLSLTHEHIYQEPLPTGALLFDGATYDLGWDGLRTAQNADTPAVPTFDHAIYLINTVKFRCGQLYHLFDETEFMRNLHEFYTEPKPNATGSLWYIHFLLIIAFGKGFVKHKQQGTKPAGAELFVNALQLLPDVSVLHQEPIESTEILCCVALYLQALDFRSSAHNYIGQAMRMAMAEGMHIQMPIEYLGENLVQRCRKIWWTVYILDREMTSLMGLPQTLNDDHVNAHLPAFPYSIQRTAAIGMHIKLSRIIAEINGTVYAMDGRLNRNFLMRTKAALANIARLADELRDASPLHLDRAQIIGILHSLQIEGLLETFLPFDLESIFISTVVLLIGPAIDIRWNCPAWLEKAYMIFEDIIESGNLIAKFRRSELQLLDELLSCFPQDQPRCLSAPVSFPNNLLNPPMPHDSLASSFHPSTNALNHDPSSGQGPTIDDDFNFTDGLTATQIMAVADSIESIDTEWMSNAMIEHSIW
ncbi:hypothetical protein N7476_004534 [Penicillium atrosanguineum]|uniref:Zn(2)-C6 fungal-type domain-containing protein n=1 Tax=Penicillium atrosanguineum TaxID=1132637 RepID=A0A9W9U618_9EURO|nr:hypothetical protein N7476_004534 [Penicillium atrosanguineum]